MTNPNKDYRNVIYNLNNKNNQYFNNINFNKIGYLLVISVAYLVERN